MPIRERGIGVVIIDEIMLLPPVTQGSVGSPEKGMVIYNSSTNKLNVYTGSAWEAVTSA